MSYYFSSSSSETAIRRRVTLFFLVSLLLHLAVVYLVDVVWLDSSPEVVAQPEPLRVTVAPPVQQSQQIVDAPRVNDTPPAESSFWGVRDQSVPEEMIAEDLGRAENVESAQSSREQSKPGQPNAAPEGTKLAKLLPDPYAGGKAGNPRTSKQQNAVERQLGPVTLLNTKSHPYSQYLIDRGYRAVRLLTLNADLTTWYFSDVQALRFPAMVRVLVAQNGDVSGMSVEQSSGSSKVDRMLLNALQGAARGTMPPVDALENGRLELVMVLEADVVKIGIR